MIYLIDRNIETSVSILADNDLNHQLLFMYNCWISKNKKSNDKYIEFYNFWRYYYSSFIKYMTVTLLEYYKRFGKTKKVKTIISEIEQEEISDLVPHIFSENYIYYKPMILAFRVYLLRKNFDYYRKFWPKLAKQNLEKYPKDIFYLTVMLNDFDEGLRRMEVCNNWISLVNKRKKKEEKK